MRSWSERSRSLAFGLALSGCLAVCTVVACDSELSGGGRDGGPGDSRSADHRLTEAGVPVDEGVPTDGASPGDGPGDAGSPADVAPGGDGPPATPDAAPAGDGGGAVCAGLQAPAGAVTIAPGTDIQAVVNSHPAGTAYLLQAGVHRMQNIKPQQGDAYYGELGPSCQRLTTLNGSRLLTGWSKSGSAWVVGGQSQQGQVHGECESGWPRCKYPEDLFIDDQMMKHVDSLSAVGPGSWYFDYGADKVYIGDDPAGHTVEVGFTRAAFSPSATSVKVVGLVVEKYAIPPQMGAIGDQYPKDGWHIEYNEVRLNHGTGVNIASNAKLLRNHLHHNGQKGMGAGGQNGLIEGNEVAYNNIAHVATGWEAGGSKFANTDGLVVRGNCVHHNHGPGLWTDIKNKNVLYEKNIVFANDKEGIFHEISYDAVIRNNLVGQNAQGKVAGWLYGANILISTSKNVELYGNTVEVNAGYGNGITIIWQDRGGDYASVGNSVHDNDVTFLGSGGQCGAATDCAAGQAEIWSKNSFDNNHYHLPSTSEAHFAWDNAKRTFSDFQSKGQEAKGTVDTQVSARNWSCQMALP